MSRLKPLRWREGMFLRPQHFQQYDLFLEQRESQRLRALEQHAWGVLHVEVDESSLSNYVFKINKLRAVLLGGALIDLPGNARVAGRSFEGLMGEAGRPLEVSIGVRDHDERGPQTAQEGSGSREARYVAAEEEIYDLDAGRDPVPIERLTYDLRVFMGDEPTDGYDAMPIARLEATGDVAEPVRLNETTFAPPTLAVAGAKALHRAGSAVVDQLSLVLRDLGQQRGSKDPDDLILYYGLSGSLPVLKDMVQEGQVHPRRLYAELARLAGALYYRDSEGGSAEEIPLYQHRDAAPLFNSLRDTIVRLSKKVVARAYRRCPMERREDRFEVVLPAEAKQAGARFFLEVEAADSLQRVPTLLMAARVSNPGRIEHLNQNALAGVPTEPQSGSPPELGPGQKATYFRLKHELDEWSKHVGPAGELAVQILNAPQDIKLNLIVTVSGS